MKTKAKNQKKRPEMSEDELSLLFQQSLKIKSDSEEGIEEEKIDRDINIEALEFHDFIHQDAGEGSPILERIAGSQTPRPIFVGGIPQGPAAEGTGERNGGDDFKYMPSGDAAGEPKYLGPPEALRGTGERIRFEDVGRHREIFPQTNQAGLFEGASEARSFASEQSFERFERAERFDAERAGRKDTFERPEAKYEKYKPKLPSSR